MMVSFLSHLHGFLFACHFTQLGLDALPSDKELPPAGTTRTSVQSPQRQTVQVHIMLSIEVLLVYGEMLNSYQTWILRLQLQLRIVKV
jgi:hypothetical protein